MRYYGQKYRGKRKIHNLKQLDYHWPAKWATIFACWHLSSVVVCNAVGGRAGRPTGAWAVGRPTLHGGPVGRHLVLKVNNL